MEHHIAKKSFKKKKKKHLLWWKESKLPRKDTHSDLFKILKILERRASL